METATDSIHIDSYLVPPSKIFGLADYSMRILCTSQQIYIRMYRLLCCPKTANIFANVFAEKREARERENLLFLLG